MEGGCARRLPGVEELTIEDAAARLGVSVSTVRRRIRDGLLMAERVTTPQGFKYRLLLPNSPPGDPPPESPPPSNPDEMAALRDERDWLRSRVEELTALLNREQETSLRLSLALGQRPAIEAPANMSPPSQGKQVAATDPGTTPQPRGEHRQRPVWQAWLRRLLGQ